MVEGAQRVQSTWCAPQSVEADWRLHDEPSGRSPWNIAVCILPMVVALQFLCVPRTGCKAAQFVVLGSSSIIAEVSLLRIGSFTDAMPNWGFVTAAHL